MSWFWFAAFCLALIWNAYLMATNSIARRDVRRLQRDVRHLKGQMRRDGVVPFLPLGGGR